MPDARIISAGYVSLDFTPKFPDTGNSRGIGIFRPGKLIEVGAATVAPGGSVTNTGLALVRLGADAVLMARIGNDEFGTILMDKYRRWGAEPAFQVADGEETSYTVVLTPPGCDRIFLSDPGANGTVTADDFPMETIRTAQYFHFGYPTLMRQFYINGGEETVRLFRKVKEAGLVTSLDLTVIDPDSPAGQEDWKGILGRVLPYVDLFAPSFEEVCAILMPEKYAELLKKADGDDVCLHLSLSNDVRPLAEEVLSLGCRAVLLKCGAAGIGIWTRSQREMDSIGGAFPSAGWGDLSIFAESFVPDRVASGTGAGDNAIAAFLFSMSRGMTPEQCLDNAAGAGALNITEYDSLSGLIPIDDLMERIAGGWERQHVIAE